MNDREVLLREEDDAWRMLTQRFDAVPEHRFDEPTLTPEGWSPKDAMFHISGWMADCGKQLDRMRAGTFDPDEESREAIERQNQAWFEVSRSMSSGDVRAGFEPSRLRMLEVFRVLEQVTPDAIEWFEESGALHYAVHAADLRRFLDEGAG
jgi:hypothetical protein